VSYKPKLLELHSAHAMMLMAGADRRVVEVVWDTSGMESTTCA